MSDKIRIRVGDVRVMIQLDSPDSMRERFDRSLEQFEAFRVVTQRVQSGFSIGGTVRVSTGRIWKGDAGVTVPSQSCAN